MPRFRRAYLLERSEHRCEYCRIPENQLLLGLQIEHIVARQHGGSDLEENLAMACAHCNKLKGPNLTSIDPETGRIVRLFNPRGDSWPKHFRVIRDEVRGTTDVGRATVALLELNDPLMRQKRQLLRRLGIRIDR